MQTIARSLTSPIFALALFSSAALIFVLQPLFGRMVTPLLGGSPQVWNTSMAFFQAALLVGYLYAHLLARLKDLRVQALIHAGVLVAAWLVLPLQVNTALGPPDSQQPVGWLLGVLTLSVGAPFAAAAATAPLLQAWYAHTARADAHDPYYLYAASNLGSFAGLLAYPTLIEPALGARAQSLAWSNSYLAVGALVAICAVLALSARGSSPKQATPVAAAPTWRRRLYWVAAAAAPSALSLGVTLHISTDIASAPLLWVVPLALYLLTYVLAFARGGEKLRQAAQLIFPFALILALVADRASDDWLVSASLVLIGFFIAALICHLALSDTRPDAGRLTEFYLCISLGGVLGGAFAALLAPLIFNNAYEYPIALAAACLFCRTQAPRFRVANAALGAAFAAFALALMLIAWAPPAPTLALGALGCTAAIMGAALGGAERSPQRRYAAVAVSAAVALLALFIAANPQTMLERAAAGERELLSVAAPWGALLLAGSFTLLALMTQALAQPRVAGDGGADFAHGFASLAAALLAMLAVLGQGFDADLLARVGLGVCAVALLLNGGRGVAMAAIVLFAFGAAFLHNARGGTIITQERSFFGIVRVREMPANAEENAPIERLLVHGATIHGAQLTTPGYTRSSLTYYNPNTALGEAVLAGLAGGEKSSLALIGLGAGSTACLTRPQDSLVIYEIDPLIVRLAGREGSDFSYVRECQPEARIELGDARLRIAEAADGAYDVIVVDAFTSDAVPAHLLTREALALYLSKTSERGIVVLHLSNRHLALVSEAARVAGAINAPTLYRKSERVQTPFAFGGLATSVMVVSRSPETLAQMAFASADWRVLTPPPGRPWSDDYVNIVRAFWENINGAEECRLWPHTCPQR